MAEEATMCSMYADADLLSVYKQRKKILNVFWLITILYLVYCGAWLAYYITLPYNHPMQALCKGAVFCMSPVYVIALFPLMGIKFSRVNRYYKALVGFSHGVKNVEKNYFYTFQKHNLQKDNIDVTFAIFESWNKHKQEWMQREAFVDKEKPLPDFGSGDYIQYIVQSNFIVQYRILGRSVLEFSEESDEDEIEEEIGEETMEEIDDTLTAENEQIQETQDVQEAQ